MDYNFVIIFMDFRMRNACRSGNLEYIKNDLESYKHIYQRLDGDNPHPLFFCASGGQNAAIEYLYNKGLFYPEIIIESIGIAAISGHLHTVEILFKIIKNNFSPKHPRLIHALNVAILKKNRKMIEYLIEKGIYDEDCEENPFLTCAEIGDVETMKLLMNKHNGCVNRIPDAMTISIMRGHRNSVNFLAGQEMV